MNIRFTKPALRQAKRIGLTEDDLRSFADYLASYPEAGSVIAGAKGYRKLRFGIPSRGIGKRGGIRVIYVVRWETGNLYVVAMVAKAEREDLTHAEYQALVAVLKELE